MTEFYIPMVRDDLLKRNSASQYVVDEVYSLRQLPPKIQEWRQALRSSGPGAILPHFDTLFSVLMNSKNIDVGTSKETWDSLLRAFSSQVDLCRAVLDENIVDKPVRVKNANIIKMLSYLICQFADILFHPVTTDKVIEAKKGRSKTTRDSAADAECERAVQAFLKLLELPVYKLWDPPVLEEEFINLVTNFCYKLLENPSINRNKSCRDACVHVIGVMVRRYNHSLAASLKLLQLVQNYEHLAAPLAQAVSVFATDYDTKSIIGDIVREISRMDFAESRDLSGTHNLSVFLTDLAERCPAYMLPHMVRLTPLLDEEPYQTRNCVLSVMGEIVVQVLGKDNLDPRHKQTRDAYLDHFEEHLHDVNAFVRSKTLQIWLNLINGKVVPLTRRYDLLELVIGRLQDVSSQVRKQAVLVVGALVKSDPFAAKLSLSDLECNYQKEMDKLKEMSPDEDLNTGGRDRSAHCADDGSAWLLMEKRVKQSINETMERDDVMQQNLIQNDDSLITVLCRIVDLLKAESYSDAVQLLRAARETFPDAAVLTDQTSQSQSESLFSDDDAEESPEQRLLQIMKSVFVDVENGRLSDLDSEQSQVSQVTDELSKQRALVQYLKDSMSFVTQVQRATVLVCQLLGSKTTTDVLEAVDFFVTCHEFGLPSALVGVRGMLNLVWSKETSVKEAVVSAYRKLYMNPASNTDNARTRALTTVKNLSALIAGATKGHLASMEELLCEFVKAGDFHGTVVQMLWERFAMKIPNTDADDSRLALIILGMVAGAEENIARSNINVIVKEGLGARAETNLTFAKEACILLMKVGPSKTKTGSTERYRLPKDHDIFTRLSDLLIKGFAECHNSWIPFMEQAVSVIYKLSEQPDSLCGSVIRQLVQNMTNCRPATAHVDHGSRDIIAKIDEEPITNGGGGDWLNTVTGPDMTTPTDKLTFLVAISGHVALKQLVYLDVDVFGEMKRRHQISENMEQNSHKRRRSATASKIKEPVGDTDEDMGLGEAATEDAEAEYIRKVCEDEIVTGSNLLAIVEPVIVAVCKNPNKYPDVQLQTAAALALAKYMLVSCDFCERHLQLLFTIMERSSSSVIRANCIVALGDLTFRFPNLIEPWTPNLYASLRDPSTQVRRNTVMVLTHLILNDMVKVKGQISEMAACILDEDQRIANLTKLFFNELGAKGNALYNIMPDAISRLSDPDKGVDEQQFRVIMKFLFGFIQKDRQCEGLVEKLCQRFQAVRSERQSRDMAFCLSLLSYTERCVRKLLENLALYGDKLGDADVYDSFTAILNGAKKFAKPEAKTLVEELEGRVEQLHNKGATEDEIANNAKKASQAARNFRKRGGRGRGGGRSPKKATIPDTAECQPSPLMQASRQRRSVRAQKPKATHDWSTSDDGSDCARSPAHKHKTPACRRRKPAALTFSSDDSD